MKSQVEVDELMARIHEEAHRRGGGSAATRTLPAQGGSAAPSAAEPSVPIPPPFQVLASSGALPGGLLVQVGQALERARRKVAVGPGVPALLRPFFRNQGGFNSILLESLECLREANRLLTVENDALRTQVEKQNRWMEAAAHGIGALETRLASLERQNDHDQHWFANLQANAEGQSAQLADLHARLDGGLNDVRSQIGEVRTGLDTQSVRTREIHGHLDDLGEVTRQTDETRTHVERLAIHLHDLQVWSDEQGEHGRRMQGHLDDLGAQLQGDEPTTISSRQKRQEEAIRRLDDRLVTDASFIKNQLWIHQRLLLASGQPPGKPETPVVPGDCEPGSEWSADAVSIGELDSLYVAFEDVFRGSREDIKGRLEIYLPYLSAARVGGSDRPLLDLGCGRGEWLELLGEHHITASGIDLNLRMIEQCRECGLPATHANAVHHLASLPDASVGAITAFHLIEHLPFAVLVRFLRECRRVLLPGGVAIYETPNPYNIIVGAAQFYDDHTHQRPLPPNSTRFLVEQAGFARAEVLPLHPREDADKVHGDGTNEALVERFNELFYGPRDYAIVAAVTA